MNLTEKRNKIAEFVIKITSICREKLGEEVEQTDNVKLSDKARSVKRFLESDEDMFGCQRGNVAKLMSILLDENIEIEDEEELDEEKYQELINCFETYCAVVEENDDVFIVNDWGGDDIYSFEYGICGIKRFATNDEIKKMVSKLDKNIVERFNFLFL